MIFQPSPDVGERAISDNLSLRFVKKSQMTVVMDNKEDLEKKYVNVHNRLNG
ncbi:hypothetical protein AN958_00020 [Leucoagaricus sp. SymC.cos]|nr:hypothetical protein AN958_00020 [Leucoagaricus sp. SymC.cos]